MKLKKTPAPVLPISLLGPKEPRRQLTQFDCPEHTNVTIGRVHGEWPSVHIAAKAHDKMWALVQACGTEVSWLSSCRRQEDGHFIIDDVFVPKQVCSICTTEVSRDGEAELLGELLQTDQHDAVKQLNCWGHSHVKLDVFASTVDEKQTDSFLRRREQRGKNLFIRVIANKWGDLFCTVYLLDIGVIVYNPTLCIEQSETHAYEGWAREQIATKVQKYVFRRAAYVANPKDFNLTDINPEQLEDWAANGDIDPELYRLLKKSEPITQGDTAKETQYD